MVKDNSNLSTCAQDKPTPRQAEPNMSDSSCKRPPCCCCIATTVVVIIIFAISAPLAAQLLSGEAPIPPGETGSVMDLHKSMIDKMSLLSFSQETSGSEGSTPTWLLATIFCGATMVSILAYLYHKKIRLPRRRSRREEQRIERERNDRNQAFLERLMREGSNPPPV